MVYVFFSMFFWPLALVSFYLRRSSQLVMLLLVLLVYVFVIGLSYKSGSDWANYLSDYKAGCVNANFDVGFRGLCVAFSLLGLDYWIFAAFLKTVFVAVLGWFLHRMGSATVAVFVLYVLISVVFLENLIRQQIAVAIFLLSISRIQHGLPWSALGFLVASLFHMSALACFPVLWLYRNAFLRGVLLFVAFVFFFIQWAGLFSSADLLKIVLGYLPNFSFSARAIFYASFDRYPVTLGHFLRFLLMTICAIVFYRSRRHNVSADEEHWLRLSYSCLLLMFFYEMVFYDFGVFWMRTREFFTVFLIIFPVVWVKRFNRKAWIPVFCGIAGYSVYVFWGLYALPVFDPLYRDYANSLIQYISPDDEHDRARDLAVGEYWENWRRGKIR